GRGRSGRARGHVAVPAPGRQLRDRPSHRRPARHQRRARAAEAGPRAQALTPYTAAFPMSFMVLPAYNEAEGLPVLLRSIRQVMEESRLEYKVVAVDDGSSDGTWDAITRHASEMPLIPVRHEVNRGLAEALRSGLQVALREAAPSDVIVTMDADN